MRYLLQMLILLGAVAFGGCSIPRAGVLYGAALGQVPVMEGSTREKIEVQPFVGRELWVHWDELPWVAVDVSAAGSQEDAITSYQEQLASRGWAKPDGPHTHPEHGQLLAVRTTSWGAVPIQHEEMWIAFRERQGRQIARLCLRADYVGGALGHAVAKPWVEVAIMAGHSPLGAALFWAIALPMEFGF
jgi:hypothetical protein